MAPRRVFWAFLAVLICLALGFGSAAWARAMGFSRTPASDVLALAAAPAAPEAGAWRSGGPYGGDVQALAISPAFRTDGFALAGGWRWGHYGATGGYGIVRTTDGGASWGYLQDENQRWPIYDLALSPVFASDKLAFTRGQTLASCAAPTAGTPGRPSTVGCPAASTAPVALSARCASRRISAPMVRSSQRSWSLPTLTPTYSAQPIAGILDAALDGTVTAFAFSRDFATDHAVFAAQFNGADATLLKRSTDGGVTWAEIMSLPAVHVRDILATYEETLLLATGDGVMRLVVDGGGYAVQTTDPNVGAGVNRLALAGDHIYAAADNGLFISLTEGRRWDRYDATPAIPFRSVAPCPFWGECHSLLAGTQTGLLFTPDDNLVPRALAAGAASPGRGRGGRIAGLRVRCHPLRRHRSRHLPQLGCAAHRG